MYQKKHTPHFLDMAAGRKHVDLLLTNARIVDVFSRRVIDGDLAIGDGRILGIGDYRARNTKDMHGCFVLPGLIDAHVHIESCMLSPRHFAHSILPRGTTTIIADPHEIANVLGLDGIHYMLDASAVLPLSILFMLPSCVPATPFENSGAILKAADLAAFMDHDQVLGLGEMMNVPGVITAQADVLAKLELARSRRKIMDGHSPGLSGKELNTYIAAGIRTDHECTTVQEMHDRISRGMYVFIREGSAARNLETLVQGLTPDNAHRCALCTDDRHPEDILTRGHLDHMLCKAVRCGVEPLTAVNMATLHPAQCYGLSNKGAVAPGYDADLCIVDGLENFSVRQVYTRGQLVAQDGQILRELPSFQDPGNSIVLSKIEVQDFRLPVQTRKANVIRVLPQSIVTEAVVRPVQADASGFFDPALNPGLNLIAVVERHKGTGNIGLGLVENFHVHGGAIATSVAHDSHNIVIIGDNAPDMLKVVEDIAAMGGGMSICRQGKIMNHLALPIAGLMHDASVRDTAARLKEMTRLVLNEMNVNPELDPFMNLSFLALPVIPELKITDKGLFDVRSFSFVQVFI